MPDDYYLPENTPFCFSDIDFDGVDELVVASSFRSESCGAIDYSVYEVGNNCAELKTEPPFDKLGKNKRVGVEFFPGEKQILYGYYHMCYCQEYLFERVQVPAEGLADEPREVFRLKNYKEVIFFENETLPEIWDMEELEVFR